MVIRAIHPILAVKAEVPILKASIIIVNRNGEDFLRQCLPSVREATSERDDIESILADNDSSDESVQVTKRLLPAVKILTLHQNHGFAGACNRAASMAQGDYLIFLNNDVVVDRDWLQELVRLADSDPLIAICGSRIMFMDSRDRINHAGGKITMIGSGYDESFGTTERSTKDVSCTGYACGASMLVRASVFWRLGGFDPTYFAMCEDVDLSWRAWIAGYKVIHVPTSVAYHKFGGTWKRAEDKLRYWHRNCKINTLKNFETLGVIRGLFLILLFDVLRVVEDLSKGSIQTVTSITSGYLWILRNIRHVIEARSLISRQRARDDAALRRIGVFASLNESLLEYRRARRNQVSTAPDVKVTSSQVEK